MGKHKTSKEKRIRKVADDALEREIKRNEEKIPDIIPESSLFEEDSQVTEKKKKIVLHPRPTYNNEQKTAEEEYNDIWGAPKQKSKKANQKKKVYPTSSMAYNSITNVRKPPPATEEKNDDVEEIVETIEEEFVHSDGLGDSMAGDIPNVPATSVKPPEKIINKNYEKIDGKIPKTMPDEQKKEKYKALREALRKVQEGYDAEILKEFVKIPQYSDEIKRQLEEIALRPKKEKIDPLLQFIAAEPEFNILEQPTNLTELPGDDRPFARLQRKFEMERKMELHQ